MLFGMRLIFNQTSTAVHKSVTTRSVPGSTASEFGGQETRTLLPSVSLYCHSDRTLCSAARSGNKTP